MKYRRIFTIVIDSFGIGAMDNAADYGDVGCDTFGHIADKVPEIKIPNLIRMGLTQLHPAPVLTSPQPSDRIGKYARLNDSNRTVPRSLCPPSALPAWRSCPRTRWRT